MSFHGVFCFSSHKAVRSLHSSFSLGGCLAQRSVSSLLTYPEEQSGGDELSIARSLHMAAPLESEPVALPEDEQQKPKIEPLRLPTVEEIRGQEIWNNCAIRSAFSGIMGGGFGLFMGMLLGALDNPLQQEEMSAKQQFIHTAKQMGRRSWTSAKTFAVMGLLFSAAECVVEKARAKHDITNTAVAGCFTGGAISAKGGPKAACAGCAGFAAFSVLIEKFLDRQH